MNEMCSEISQLRSHFAIVFIMKRMSEELIDKRNLNEEIRTVEMASQQ